MKRVGEGVVACWCSKNLWRCVQGRSEAVATDSGDKSEGRHVACNKVN